MTLQECYAALEGDYAGVTSRLPTERMVQKFVLKFLNDGSYDLLLRSMEAEAFRAAHTIKGVCQNLDFTRLYQSSSELSEALRNGFTPEAPALVERVKADYRQTTDAIRTYQTSNGL